MMRLFYLVVSDLQEWWYLTLVRFGFKSAVFVRWKELPGLINATTIATDYYMATGQWADEIKDYAPVPAREEFYIYVAIELGDPRTKDWLMQNAHKFHQLFAKYFNIKRPPTPNGLAGPEDSASALLQYLLWYERDGPKLDSKPQSHTESAHES